MKNLEKTYKYSRMRGHLSRTFEINNRRQFQTVLRRAFSEVDKTFSASLYSTMLEKPLSHCLSGMPIVFFV